MPTQAMPVQVPPQTGSSRPQRRLDARNRLAIAASLAIGACAAPPPTTTDTPLDLPVLQHVANWTIQLQGLEDEHALRRLETAAVDMVVVEPMRSQRGMSDFPAAAFVQRLQKSGGASLPHKRAIAYLNLGQAEDYRAYWRPEWRAPTADAAGEPSFLLSLDPDGWQGNFPVAYWDPRWRACLWGSPEAPLDQLIADGFDGVYLDWILGFEDPKVAAAAAAQGVDPATAMVDLIADLRAYARERYPLFVVIAQNALPLGEQRADLLRAIDAFAQEDVSFRGTAGVAWDDAGSGDIPAPIDGENSTAQLCARLQKFAARGLPVFTLDYAQRPENIAAAVQASRSHGLVPCVARTPLDRLAEPLPPAATPSPR